MIETGFERINTLLKDTGYKVERLETGEIVISGKAKVESQPNLFAHLRR